MKTFNYIQFLLLMFFIVNGCTPRTNEEKAQKLIKEFILKSANDPKSYDPVEFSKLDYYVVPFDVIDGFPDEFKDTLKLYVELESARATFVVFGNNQSEIDSLEEKLAVVRRGINDFKNEYDKKQFRHFVMTHKFRAKNAMGALMLSEMRFTLDTSLTKVLGSINTSDLP